MDLFRSSYSARFRFVDGGPIVTGVTWYRAAPDALAFPGVQTFASQTLDEKSDTDVGEVQPPRGPWRNGMRPSLYSGQGFFRGTLNQFQFGQQADVLLPDDVTVADEPLTLAVNGLGELSGQNGQEVITYTFFSTGGVRWTMAGLPCCTDQLGCTVEFAQAPISIVAPIFPSWGNANVQNDRVMWDPLHPDKITIKKSGVYRVSFSVQIGAFIDPTYVAGVLLVANPEINGVNNNDAQGDYVVLTPVPTGTSISDEVGVKNTYRDHYNSGDVIRLSIDSDDHSGNQTLNDCTLSVVLEKGD